MKTKLKISAAMVLFLASAITFSLAQFPGAPSQTINPATGLPVPQVAAPPSFDPKTGQPIEQAGPDWKDANWKDSDITLTNVAFDGIPLSEVAKYLTDHFKDQFD